MATANKPLNSKTDIEKTISEFDQLCQEYLKFLYQNETGFISYQSGEKETHAQDKIFLTYGEILYPSINLIIEQLDIQESDVFYDLGSGIGKVGLCFLLKTPVKKVCGIEFSEKRHQVAEKIYQQVRHEFSELFLDNRELSSVQGNFLEANISDATVIYSCSTCFSEELLKDMGKLFEQCPNIRYVVSMKPIPLKFPLHNVLDIECSWDKSKCHIYKAG